MRPRILVPLALMRETKGDLEPIHFARETYIRKLAAYGLAPLFVSPALPDDIADELYNETAGVLCMGGSDIDPKFYNAPVHPKTETGDIRRDQLELRVLRKAVSDKKPILAICRGHQALNVALGGTLIQHLPDVFPEEKHADIDSYYDMLKPTHGHPVKITPETKTSALIQKPEIFVTSGHHQAVEKLGKDLRVAGTSPAGVIEIIEHIDPNYFCFGVQSHPECCSLTAKTGEPDKSGLEVFFAEFAKAVK